jgi:hypothetical protein
MMTRVLLLVLVAAMAASAQAQTAYRTITALDGVFCPSPDATAYWATNPRGYATGAIKARFFVTLTTRGTTALADNPTITVRPLIRSGGTSGACGIGTSSTAQRPRLADSAASFKVKKTTDLGASYTDYSSEANDNSAATDVVASSLDTLANEDWLLFSAPSPFIGLAIDMDASAVNGNAADTTCQYWNGAWTDVTNQTDGTDTGANFAQDGQITWSLPSDWVTSTIDTVTAYQLRCHTSAALDASTTIDEVEAVLPTRVAIDVTVNGDDAGLLIESNSGGTGTLAFEGSIVVVWK